MKDVYRACASIVVLKKEGDSFKVLLLHKPRKKDAWQLPQGGVDPGETHAQAAVRELKEEAGLDVAIAGKSKQIYQYDFPPSYRRFRPDDVCGQRLEFFFAKADPAQKVKVDQSEIDSFVWVTKEEISQYVKRKEYFELIEELVEEGIKLFGSLG
ncbi:NUDIX domain-containing protein [Patescibacteria group bacterium]|nr:NUDIX domain-containing protein [Patescibacteria group bacterium]